MYRGVQKWGGVEAKKHEIRDAEFSGRLFSLSMDPLPNLLLLSRKPHTRFQKIDNSLVIDFLQVRLIFSESVSETSQLECVFRHHIATAAHRFLVVQHRGVGHEHISPRIHQPHRCPQPRRLVHRFQLLPHCCFCSSRI